LVIISLSGVGTKTMKSDLIDRLRKRAEIRRQIPSRKSVQNNEPDRIADLLEEAANELTETQKKLSHLEKMVVWYEDITLRGTHSDEYENGFWAAVEFVERHQNEASASCNSFCGEYECKENQANCKRIKK
jgi:hypothetical protein